MQLNRWNGPHHGLYINYYYYYYYYVALQVRFAFWWYYMLRQLSLIRSLLLVLRLSRPLLIIWWFVGCSEKYYLRLSSDDWFGWMLKRYGGDYIGQCNILWPSTCMEGEQAVVKIILLTHNDILVSESLYHSSRRTFCVMPRSTATAPIPLCRRMGSVHFGPLCCSKMFLKGVDRVGWRYYWPSAKICVVTLSTCSS
jgi:hypothetical protein